MFSGPRASTKKYKDRHYHIGRDPAPPEESTGTRYSAGTSSVDGEGSQGDGTSRKRSRGNNSYPIRRWDEGTASYRRVDKIGNYGDYGDGGMQHQGQWKGMLISKGVTIISIFLFFIFFLPCRRSL